MGLMKKTKTLRHAVFTGAMAVVLATGMTLPAFAADEVAYMTTEDSDPIIQEAAFTDEAVGLSWDGADTITMSDASLLAIEIAGNATIQLEGENTVSFIGADGDLTIQGDAEAATEDKPVLNLVGTEAWEEGYNIAGIEADTIIIEGITVNVDENTNYVFIYGGEGEGVTIDHTKIAPADTETEVYIEVWGDDANVDIIESDIDLGTMGGICADGIITIDNSDLTTRYKEMEEMVRKISHDPQLLHSHSGKIVLKNMANGEILYEGDDYAWVVTGDEDGVFLKAASTPGYYVEKQETPASEPAATGDGTAIPSTGDATGTAASVCLALAVCALGALAIARRRTQQ